MDFLGSFFSSTASAKPGKSSALLTTAQGMTTLFSALSRIGAGSADADQMEAGAWATERQAATAEAQSLQRQTELKRRLLQTLGQNDVAYAAAGVDLTQGVAAQANAEAERRATDELTIERAGLTAELGQYGTRARLQRRMARAARRASYLEAGGIVGSGLIDIAERG